MATGSSGAAKHLHREAGKRADRTLQAGRPIVAAAVAGDLGRADERRELYGQALTIARETGDRTLECNWLRGLANGHFECKEWDEARDLLERALSIATDLGARKLVATTVAGLGVADQGQGRSDQARTRLAEAEAIAVTLKAGPDSHVASEIAELRDAIAAATNEA